MLYILIQHAYDTYNDYVLALKGNRGIEWQSPEAYKSFPWGGGALGAFTVHVCICTLYKQVYDILNYVFFFRRLAALQKRRELRAAGIE